MATLFGGESGLKREKNNGIRLITARDYLALLAGASFWFIYIFQTRLYVKAGDILYFINYPIAYPVFHFCSAAFVISIILDIIHLRFSGKITRIMRYIFIGLFALYAIALILAALSVIVLPNIGFDPMYNWIFLSLGGIFAFSIHNQ